MPSRARPPQSPRREIALLGHPILKPSLTDTLCTQCGKCCDGSPFADAELASNEEASAIDVMGLEIEDDEDDAGLLLQPCQALKGKRAQ